MPEELVSSPICRGKNLTWETVFLFYDNMPRVPMPLADFHNYVEANVNGWRQTHSQIARQLGFYYEENGVCYPRFAEETTYEDLAKYMKFWATHYFIPNPYTPSIRGFEPTNIYESLCEQLDNGVITFDAACNSILGIQLNSTDKLRVYLNNFTELGVNGNRMFYHTGMPRTIAPLHPGLQEGMSVKEFYDYFDVLGQEGVNNMPDPPTEEKPGYNKLIYGAPGTSKSWTVDEEIVKGHKTFRITFHPDTDYATFVGCYKPETIDVVEDGEIKKRIGYGFHKQVFLEAYIEAWTRLESKEPVFLVIEEINRGNCAQIFGDIFQLLDRRKDGYSRYTINADTDIAHVLADIPNYKQLFVAAYPEKENDWRNNLMALPTNLNIVATMNTSDQSLYQMDSAFKRRWDQVYFPIKYGDANKATLNLGAGNEYRWGDLLLVLNNYIKKNTESANKTIGNRFIDFERTDRVISYKTFRDKVLFYLFTDVFKDDIDFSKDFFGEGFDTEHQFFEDLCENEDPRFTVAFIKKIDEKGILAHPDSTEEEQQGEEANVVEE
jgi:GTPase subunit of restriction endonuclease